MNEKYKKYLPLGSVVLLKEAKKRVMIIGYIAKIDATPEKIFDYVGCLYPEGVLSSDKNFLFNHDSIDRIYAIGYSDEEQKEFSKVVDEIDKTLPRLPILKNSENSVNSDMTN